MVTYLVVHVNKVETMKIEAHKYIIDNNGGITFYFRDYPMLSIPSGTWTLVHAETCKFEININDSV